jgi:DNA repair protein RadA/Sms
VLEKRAGLSLAGDDVYVNIAGGMNIEEPAADLSVVAAVASSVRNRGVAPSTAMFGEVGLSGEVRASRRRRCAFERRCSSASRES